MINKLKLVYLDESGDPNMPAAGPSDLYVIAAITVDADQENKLNDSAIMLQRKHFSSGQMKSSSIGDNDKKRLLVLSELNENEFGIMFLVVDKNELISPGFGYKTSFYKFMHTELFDLFIPYYNSIQIICDRWGRPDFMPGFKTFVATRTGTSKDQISLEFAQAITVDFSNSKDSPIVQCADLLAGSLRRLYRGEIAFEFEGAIKALLMGPKLRAARRIPNDFYSRLPNQPDNSDAGVDELIVKEVARSLDNYFMNFGRETDQIEQYRLATLHYLKIYFYWNKSGEFVPTSEIIANITNELGDNITSDSFRLQVIGKLRDRGILICGSSAKKGYRLPSCLSDLDEHVRHCNSIVVPMISRLTEFRNRVNVLADIDILSNYPKLRILVDT